MYTCLKLVWVPDWGPQSITTSGVCCSLTIGWFARLGAAGNKGWATDTNRWAEWGVYISKVVSFVVSLLCVTTLKRNDKKLLVKTFWDYAFLISVKSVQEYDRDTAKSPSVESHFTLTGVHIQYSESVFLLFIHQQNLISHVLSWDITMFSLMYVNHEVLQLRLQKN